jgi:ABC-type nickel/cobalt efflux system permease component RcnA
MKLSQILLSISLLAIISCTNNKSKNGHDHGPNGEHLESSETNHDTKNKQEVFEIKKDSVQIDSLKNNTPKEDENKAHKHSDGHEHSH